jgi:hypothetical protein
MFSVTYEIVTKESAREGDVAESGFISQGSTLRDAIADVRATRTSEVDGVAYIEPSDSRIGNARSVTIGNGMEYLTGAYESRSIHFPDNLTSATRVRIARILGVHV